MFTNLHWDPFSIDQRKKAKIFMRLFIVPTEIILNIGDFYLAGLNSLF